jgi:hypothetical protein
MTLHFLPEAEQALLEISLWVEERNTPGSGFRYAEKFIAKIERYALPKANYALCKSRHLADLDLHCIAIDDWIIAFKISGSKFVVHYIIHGSGLK